ncbi:MAG: type II toxin-antitoxin system HigB family toxin [Candidatus Omnitrophica bacterium]|nr:type II toxin-antitoxin system HigB family toxin [Candidatus Omnitrophota bacterium]MDE2231241.1 type II toxin-antitoxin system HigB family toxin [Candidatus Omnitrophota bacterium]
MHVISRRALQVFWEKYPDSEEPLKVWFKIIRLSEYEGFNDLKKTFGSVDKVGDKYVFNIGRNKYRLITAIHFNVGRVYIRAVLTHKEYDKEEWKNG